MAAKVSGRVRIAGMARSYQELLQTTGNWDIAIDFPGLHPGYRKRRIGDPRVDEPLTALGMGGSVWGDGGVGKS